MTSSTAASWWPVTCRRRPTGSTSASSSRSRGATASSCATAPPRTPRRVLDGQKRPIPIHFPEFEITVPSASSATRISSRSSPVPVGRDRRERPRGSARRGRARVDRDLRGRRGPRDARAARDGSSAPPAPPRCAPAARSSRPSRSSTTWSGCRSAGTTAARPGSCSAAVATTPSSTAAPRSPRASRRRRRARAPRQPRSGSSRRLPSRARRPGPSRRRLRRHGHRAAGGPAPADRSGAGHPGGARHAQPTFPEDDLMFFRARADEDPDSLLAFLDAHGGRPAGEGAEPQPRASPARRRACSWTTASRTAPGARRPRARSSGSSTR